MNTKTIFKTLALAMMMPAMLLTTACSSDDDAVNDNANNQKKYYEIPVTVTVTRQGDGTRATYDEGTKTLSFSTGDKLFVNGHHNTAGTFAGALDLVSASDGTFEGTVIAEASYNGTAEAFLKETGTHASATLLPAGYENYNYLKFKLNDDLVNAITSPWTYVSAIFNNSLLPLGKAEAVAQLSYEFAPNYDNYVFALSPQRPVICCTINGLPAETSVQVVYDGKYNDFSGYITTDGSGTATFAFTDFAEDPLGSLTVNGNAITLPSNVKLEAGKVYKINRSIIPAEPAVGHALSASAVGEIVCSDGLAYAAADKDNLPTGVTAVAIVAYLGDGDTSDNTYNNGLAIAMSNANGGFGANCEWAGWGEYNCVSKSNDIAIAIGYKDGISSTNTLTSDDHSGHNHEAATAAVSNNGTAAPTGTSGWFLPSIGQWNLIVQGLASKKAGSAVTTDITRWDDNDTYTASNLNSVITDAGGTGFNGDYHSSTQYDSEECWHMNISSGRAWSYGFSAGDYVRSVLAF